MNGVVSGPIIDVVGNACVRSLQEIPKWWFPGFGKRYRFTSKLLKYIDYIERLAPMGGAASKLTC
jgi:hypothetical protein